MKLPFKLIAIDLETTDSDSNKGSIIQIGSVIVNEDLSMGDSFLSTITPLDDYRNPTSMEVHKITEEELKNGESIFDALNKFEIFSQQVDKRPILAAWGTYFDINFLEETYKKINRRYPFSYKCIDLKSIAIWEAAKYNIPLAEGLQKFLQQCNLEFDGNPHNGLDDIKNTIKLLQKLNERTIN